MDIRAEARMRKATASLYSKIARRISQSHNDQKVARRAKSKGVDAARRTGSGISRRTRMAKTSGSNQLKERRGLLFVGLFGQCD